MPEPGISAVSKVGSSLAVEISAIKEDFHSFRISSWLKRINLGKSKFHRFAVQSFQSFNFFTMPKLNGTVLHRWFQDVWNEGREEVIDELLDEDGIVHDLTDEDSLKGPSGFRTFYHGFRSQFSNIHIDVVTVVSEENIESAHCNVSATHTESGKNVSFSGISMVRVNNGKITEAWNNFDFMKMNTQLGYKLVAET